MYSGAVVSLTLIGLRIQTHEFKESPKLALWSDLLKSAEVSGTFL